MSSAQFYIGTSGWAYKEWGKKFFPKDLPQRKQLTYLADHFNTLELNASFYRLQPPSNFKKWDGETPDDFVFAVKLSRYITHIRRMKTVAPAWNRFIANTKPLGKKLGPILVQFPSNFRGNDDQIKRIEVFLGRVRKKHPKLRLAFEFRYIDCYRPEMLTVLKQHKAALVFPNSSRYPHAPMDFAPADFVYYRLHGPRRMFASGYKDDELKQWAKGMKAFQKQGKDVYVYFNNDMHTHAPANAELLQKLVKFKR